MRYSRKRRIIVLKTIFRWLLIRTLRIVVHKKHSLQEIVTAKIVSSEISLGHFCREEMDPKPKLISIRDIYNVGPIPHGANSSSPTSFISLFVFLPLATARISSKISFPTSSTGMPSRILPALISISSII